MKSLTVIISSYFYGSFVANAIDSVLSQTIQPNEIIAVDDGSHDETETVAKRYGIKCIVREKNMGIVDNYNDILKNHIKTDKVMVLAADDALNPLYIAKMNLDDYGIISSDLLLFGSEAHKIVRSDVTYRPKDADGFKDGYFIRRFHPELHHIHRVNYIHGSSIYDVSLARLAGGYVAVKEKNKRKEEDWGLFRNMMKHGARHHHVAEPLLWYRKHRFNLNGTY